MTCRVALAPLQTKPLTVLSFIPVICRSTFTFGLPFKVIGLLFTDFSPGGVQPSFLVISSSTLVGLVQFSSTKPDESVSPTLRIPFTYHWKVGLDPALSL